MIRKLGDSLNLGLRPWGQYELVAPDGTITFSSVDPGGEPLDILINPDEVAFSLRPRTFLTDLRNSRAKLLETVRKAKRQKSDKGTTDGTTKTTRKRTTKSLPQSVLNGLAGLPEAQAEALRRAFGLVR